MMIRTALAILLLVLTACGGGARESAAPPGAAAFDREESEALLAADFMVERLRLYPSEELYVQRQVNAALKTYLEEQRALPVRNESTQTYGARLAEFYDSLLAERPAYEAPSGIFNLAPHEIPTALITGGAGYVYFSTLGGS